MLKVLLSSLILLIIATARAHAQAATACPDADVEYSHPTKDTLDKIKLTKSVIAAEVPAEAKHNLSMQGTRWFVEIDPDYMSTKQRWTTTLYIQSGLNGKSILKASFLDHGNTFSAHWINDKLLFVQVWWGRFASSDLIIDVDQGTLIYNEFAHYGQLSQPSCE